MMYRVNSHILHNLHQFAALHFNTLNSCHHWNWSFMIFLHPQTKIVRRKTTNKNTATCLERIRFPHLRPAALDDVSQGFPSMSHHRAKELRGNQHSKLLMCLATCFNWKSSGWTMGFQLWPDHQSEISGSIYINLMIQTRFHDFSLASTSTTSSEDIRSSILLTIMTITPSYPPIPKNIATRASCLEAKSSRTWFRWTHWPLHTYQLTQQCRKLGIGLWTSSKKTETWVHHHILTLTKTLD